MELDVIPRLAVGNHPRGSGFGCIMNLMCWEDGRSDISDYAPGFDYSIRRVLIHLNDRMCTHGDGLFLCTNCTMFLLDAAHTLRYVPVECLAPAQYKKLVAQLDTMGGASLKHYLIALVEEVRALKTTELDQDRIERGIRAMNAGHYGAHATTKEFTSVCEEFKDVFSAFALSANSASSASKALAFTFHKEECLT